MRPLGIIVVLAAVLIAPAAARAQAWALPEGLGSVSIVYHHVFVEDHLFAGGEARDVGHIRSHVVSFDVDYGLTDRLSLRALLPYVAARFEGTFEHQPEGPHSHSGLQDFRGEARYGALEFPIAVAPFIAITVPTHDYEFFAHSAIGLNMLEVQAGTYVGAVKGAMSFHGRASFGLYERVAGHRRNRSNFDAEVGWMAGRRVRLFGFQAAQISHGGVDLDFSRLPQLVREHWWPHHDQIGRANMLNAGGGLSIGLGQSTTVHGAVMTTLAGSNTHAAKYAFTLGATFSFQGRTFVHPHPPRR